MEVACYLHLFMGQQWETMEFSIEVAHVVSLTRRPVGIQGKLKPSHRRMNGKLDQFEELHAVRA